MCVGWADEWSPVICSAHDWVRLSETQSWSQRDFISGSSTSSGLAMEWILFPSVPEAETILFDKREDWGFYLAQPFPSWFPYPAAILCRSFTSSRGFGTWPPLQWFFQLLNKRRQTNVSLLTPGEFGYHPYVTPMSPVAWVPSLHWQMNVLVCRCWSATQEVKITWVFLQKCQFFSGKFTCEFPYSRAVLTESSLGAILSTGCVDMAVQTSFSTWYLLLGSAAEAHRQGGVLPYPRRSSR